MRKQREEKKAQKDIVGRVSSFIEARKLTGLNIKEFCIQRARIEDPRIIRLVEDAVEAHKHRGTRKTLFQNSEICDAMSHVEAAVQEVWEEKGRRRADRIANRRSKSGLRRLCMSLMVGQAA